MLLTQPHHTQDKQVVGEERKMELADTPMNMDKADPNVVAARIVMEGKSCMVVDGEMYGSMAVAEVLYIWALQG